MQVLHSLCVFECTLMEFAFQKKSYVAAMPILQRTWLNCVRSKNRVLYDHAQMSGLK